MQRPVLALALAAATFSLGCSGGSSNNFGYYRLDFSQLPDLRGRDLAVGGEVDLAEPNSGSDDRPAIRFDLGPEPDQGIPDQGAPPDLAQGQHDLATSQDSARPPDFARAGDLAKPICRIRINEVQTEGLGGADDELIELYNPCPQSVDLTDYKLVYRSAAGVGDVALATLGLRISALGYLVYAQTNYPGAADARYGGTIAGSMTGGGVALRDPGGNQVDGLGYGAKTTNAFVEKAPSPSHAAGRSLQRLPDGTDTDDNSRDFRESVPTPKAANR